MMCSALRLSSTLVVALASVTDDLIEVRKINLVLLHSSLVILNTYFLLLYYGIL